MKMQSHHVGICLAAVIASGLLLFCGGPAVPLPAANPPAENLGLDSGSGARDAASASRPEDRAASKDAPVDAGSKEAAGASTGIDLGSTPLGMTGPGKPFGTPDGGPTLGFGTGRGTKRDGGVPSNGHLDAGEIRRVVRGQMATYQQCYEAALAKTPKLAGKVSVHFVVGVDGSVLSAENKASTLADETVVECVVRAFSKLRFPVPEGGTVDVVYPLDFGTKK